MVGAPCNVRLPKKHGKVKKTYWDHILGFCGVKNIHHVDDYPKSIVTQLVRNHICFLSSFRVSSIFFGGWTLRQGVSSLADLQLWVMLKMTQKWRKYHSFNQYRMQWVVYWVYYGLVFWAWNWRKEMILETAIEMGKVMNNQWNGPGSALSSQIQCSGLIYHTTPRRIISIIYIYI